MSWKPVADTLNELTDEEIARASAILNPSGKTAGEEVDEALEKLIEMGILPADDEE